MVDGYEGGYDDPVAPKVISVSLDSYDNCIYGSHEDGRDFPAILIARPGR